MALLAQTALLATFAFTLESEPFSQIIPMVAMEHETTQPSVEHKGLTSAPVMTLWRGHRSPKAPAARGVRINNEKYEASMHIEVDDELESITSLANGYTVELAARGAYKRYNIVQQLIQYADTTTLGAHWDGGALFSTSFTDGKSGAQNNDLAAAQIPSLNVTTPTAPTPEEAAQALHDAVVYSTRYKDDEGVPCNLGARKFVIWCPPNLAGPFGQALSREFLSQGASNPILGLLARGYSFEVHSDPEIDWTVEWALIRTDGKSKGIIIQDEIYPQLKILDETSEYAIQTDLMLLALKCKTGGGYGVRTNCMKLTFS